MILVHFKRATIDKETLSKMMSNTTYAKSGVTYTDATLMLMNNHWLKYIDHYYVGPDFTYSAKKMYNEAPKIELKDYTNSAINNKTQEVEVSHTAVNYIEFLEDEKFDILEKLDPNTVEGFIHCLANNINLDEKHTKRINSYIEKNPGIHLTTEERSKLGRL